MAQCDGDGVGGIVGLWHLVKMQQPLGHIHHLMLGSIAIAHQRLLDLHWLIGIDLQARLLDSQQHHTSGLGNSNAGGNVLTEKQFFDGHRIRLADPQQFHHIIVDHFQPPGKICIRRRGDGAAAEQPVLPIN